jgi:hypothetical protein
MQAAPLNPHVSSWRLLLLLSLLLVCYLGLLTWHVHVHACWCRPQGQALPPHIILMHLYSHANLQGNKTPTAEVKRALVLACRNRPGQHTAFCCFPLHPLSVTLQVEVSAEHAIHTARTSTLQTCKHPQVLLVPHVQPVQGMQACCRHCCCWVSLVLESAGFVCFCPCTNLTAHVF